MDAGTLSVSLSQLSIKTRIETYKYVFFRSLISCLSQLSIKTRIETTQAYTSYFRFFICLSQLSIKTRIETRILCRGLCRGACLSQLSIKTRIETKKMEMF